MQAFGFMPKEISKIKYLLMKTFQGVLSSMLVTLFFLVKTTG
jgi:hypothetical protein